MRRLFALVVAAALALSIAGMRAPERAVAAPAVKIAVALSTIAQNSPYGRQNTVMANYDLLVAEFGAGNVSIIGDTELHDADLMAPYAAVVLCNQNGMDSAMRNALRDYVAHGGGLVVSAHGGRWDYQASRVPQYKKVPEAWKWPNYGYQWLAWEWGEVSEVYGLVFNNDPRMWANWHAYGAAPSSHPILSGAAADLGQSASLNISDTGDQFNELNTLYPSHPNMRVFMTYGTRTNASSGDDAANGSVAGWTNAYGLGRVVGFGFMLHDLAAGRGAGSGTQAQAAALMVNSVKWAADPALLGAGPTYGAQIKAPLLSSSASFSSGVVRLSGTVRNGGDTPTRGYFLGEVRDPSGTKRFSYYAGGDRIALRPGTSYSASWGYAAGTRPAAGRWTARIGYEYYDWMRGGMVWFYRDIFLSSNGTSMRYAGASGWYSSTPSAAGPGIAGADRYVVASSISATGWAGGPGTGNAVILATGVKFSDALAASPLAGKLDAPILLVPRGGLPPSAAAELRRMYAGRDSAVIYAIGSPLSMPAAAVTAARNAVAGVLNASGTVQVRTIGGADDFTLARAVAAQVGAPATGNFAHTAIIASYSAYADALSISPLAAKHGIPILFVTSTSIPLATQRALTENGIEHCLIVGGPATVSPGVEAWLETKGYRVAGVADNAMGSPDTRLAGATRYDVSVNAARYGAAFGGMDPSTLFIASGLVWPDALAAGPLAGRLSHPVLLIHGRDINYSLASGIYLAGQRESAPAVVFLGGNSTITSFARGQVGVVLGSTP